MISDFYYRKLVQWQNDPRYRSYTDYVRKNRLLLASEFKNDPTFREVCEFVRSYAKGQEKNILETVVKEALNPEEDVLNILVAATLDACGYPTLAGTLLSLAIGGLIGAAVISVLDSLFSKK